MFSIDIEDYQICPKFFNLDKWSNTIHMTKLFKTEDLGQTLTNLY